MRPTRTTATRELTRRGRATSHVGSLQSTSRLAEDNHVSQYLDFTYRRPHGKLRKSIIFVLFFFFFCLENQKSVLLHTVIQLVGTLSPVNHKGLLRHQV